MTERQAMACIIAVFAVIGYITMWAWIFKIHIDGMRADREARQRANARTPR